MSDGLTLEGEYSWVETRDDGLHAGVHFEMPEDLAEDFRDVLADSSLTWTIQVEEGVESDDSTLDSDARSEEEDGE